MTKKKVTEAELSAWIDGEGSRNPMEVEAMVSRSAELQHTAEAWRGSAQALRDSIDDDLADVDPLWAASRIHQKIRARERRSLAFRLKTWFGEQWLFDRRRMMGVMAAAGLGALAAPGVLWWASQQQAQNDVSLASVIVESVEVGDGARAVVYTPEGSATTLIWVEPHENNEPTP